MGTYDPPGVARCTSTSASTLDGVKPLLSASPYANGFSAEPGCRSDRTPSFCPPFASSRKSEDPT
ncbi:hypothetical protein COSO111634_31275 [Corallococcus soli]